MHMNHKRYDRIHLLIKSVKGFHSFKMYPWLPSHVSGKAHSPVCIPQSPTAPDSTNTGLDGPAKLAAAGGLQHLTSPSKSVRRQLKAVTYPASPASVTHRALSGQVELDEGLLQLPQKGSAESAHTPASTIHTLSTRPSQCASQSRLTCIPVSAPRRHSM